MPHRIFLVRTYALSATVGGVLFFGASAQSTHVRQQQEQQQDRQQTSESPQQSSQPQPVTQPSPQPDASNRPKPKKVWTNDEVVTLRSPADKYQADKEAQDAADAETAVRKADLAKQVKEAGLTLELPATPEETRRSIKSKEEQIKDLEQRLDLLNHEPPDADGSKKEAIQKQIEGFSGDLRKAQLELKVLQEHLRDLTKTAPPEPTSVTPWAPAPENPQ
jgi:hypothetical protein